MRELWWSLGVVCLLLTGCAKTQGTGGVSEPVTVYKSSTCGCCSLWVRHLAAAGFKASVEDSEDMGSVKQRLGIPYGMGSCHTAKIEGYFIEGHVPAADIARLLRERPRARGLAVPGMPAGAPGMETPDGLVQPYDVLLVREDGTTSVYASHGLGADAASLVSGRSRP